MDDLYSNIVQNPESDNQPGDIFSKLEIPWDKSKEDAWEALSEKINTAPQQKVKKLVPVWIKIAAAAAILLIVALPALFYFSTTTVYCASGEHKDIQLPDGSKVTLNANTSVTYKPYWWYISRKATLTGEAFFKVEKGSAFQVVSQLGATEVLGTSFNIYARANKYTVTCITGKVRVKAIEQSNEVIIHPNQFAAISPDGEINVQKNYDTGISLAWTNNQFIFTTVPIKDVFDEIARQYGIRISFEDDFQYKYTGNFKKTGSIEDILNIVNKPFGLTFVKKTKTHYLIKKFE